ncbi:MAG: S1 RNA-binding domain-containing protein, partial [Candidatus Moraniibacteriota bacterium]
GEKLIVSEKAAQSEKEKEFLNLLHVGDTIEGTISGVVDFGAFVKFALPGEHTDKRLEGLVHISELAWQLIDDPREIVKTGDAVIAKIIGIDDNRISLSMKALKADPWENVAERYKVGDEVSGTVDKMNHFGAFVYLDKDIHGLAHVSEFGDVYPGRKMEEVFETGKTYSWKILSIEPRTHRLGLLPVKK